MSDFPAFSFRSVTAEGKPGFTPTISIGGDARLPASAGRAQAFSDVFLGLHAARAQPEADPETRGIEPAPTEHETTEKNKTASAAGPAGATSETGQVAAEVNQTPFTSETSAHSSAPVPAESDPVELSPHASQAAPLARIPDNIPTSPLPAGSASEQPTIQLNPGQYGLAQTGETALHQTQPAATAPGSVPQNQPPALEVGRTNPTSRPDPSPARAAASSDSVSPNSVQPVAISVRTGVENSGVAPLLASTDQSTGGNTKGNTGGNKAFATAPKATEQARNTAPHQDLTAQINPPRRSFFPVARGIGEQAMQIAAFSSARDIPAAPVGQDPAIKADPALLAQPRNEPAALQHSTPPETLQAGTPNVRPGPAGIAQPPDQAVRPDRADPIARGQAPASPIPGQTPQPTPDVAVGGSREEAARRADPLMPNRPRSAGVQANPPALQGTLQTIGTRQQTPAAFAVNQTGVQPLSRLDQPVVATRLAPSPASASGPAVAPAALTSSVKSPPQTEAMPSNPERTAVLEPASANGSNAPAVLPTSATRADEPRAEAPPLAAAPTPAQARGATTTTVIAQPASGATAPATNTQAGPFAGSDQAADYAETFAVSASAPLREAGSYAAQALGAQASGRPEMARHVALQIASAMHAQSGGQVELSLNPEELGRVRLSLTPGDGTMLVSIVAERGETLDLMRRHINLLAEEFQELGYSDLQFDFGTPQRGDDRSRHVSQNVADEPFRQPEEPTVTIAGAPLARSGSNGLDLRF